MTAKEKYAIWKKRAVLDEDVRRELIEIDGDDAAIEERFYKDLEFGTGGLRGIIGAGSARMNIYTVGKATEGLARYVADHGKNKRAAIAYDCRIKSDLFAKTAASILAANGIETYIYSELMPTPMLSYAVRYLGCDAGIVITASHNPAKYNGYKVYGPDGCQMTIKAANEVLGYINTVDVFDGVDIIDYETAVKAGNIKYITEDVIESYLDEVEKQRVSPDIDMSELRVIYTPLHGTGNKPVEKILKRCGADNIFIVPEQREPDGNFPTTPFPNPEFRQAFECALRYTDEKKPDVLLATDPDCDRVGIAARDGDDYRLFTGNELGVLLLNYIIERREENGTMPKNPVAVKTIVSTELAAMICKKHGVEIRNVLTGFKFIGEQIGLLEKEGKEDNYIFGFEESYGYLAGSYVRDKDGVVASMLVCEMTAYYREKSLSLLDVLEGIYKEYGYYFCAQNSYTLEGQAGLEKIASLMEKLRSDDIKTIGGEQVVKRIDYLYEDTGLPKSNVLAYHTASGDSLLVRPSGTEPKIKLYVHATANTEIAAKAKLAKMEKESAALIGF